MGKLVGGAGWCTNERCEDYARTVFRLDQSHELPRIFHRCPRCLELGAIEHRRQVPAFTPDVPHRQVRFEWGWDTLERRYRGVSIVTDESLDHGATLTLYDPLVNTEKRSLVMAESALANANLSQWARDARTGRGEIVLSMDLPRPEYGRKLDEWASSLFVSHLATR